MSYLRQSGAVIRIGRSPFILASGALVGSTRDDLDVTAPLTAITATVVGAILNIALLLAYQVLWPEGFAGRFKWPLALIVVAVAVAPIRFKRGVIEVIAACALIGLATALL
jgi:chromate transporter